MILRILLFLFCVNHGASDMWVDEFSKKECYQCSRYEYDKANFSSILPISDNKIVVGAKNTIFKIEFGFHQVVPYVDEIEDNSSAYVAYRNCKNSGRSDDKCQNYYKVLVKINEYDVMVCGTQSYTPICDIRQVNNLRYKARNHMIKGEAICPSDPATSTSVLVLKNELGIGFSATCVKDCTDYQISRINLQPTSLSVTGKTFHTSEWLNSPTFIYSFEEEEYSYFLFYETAIEERSERVYSRIARVCKNDIGSGQDYFKNYFLSFSKARIYCTSNKPGETPFNHNEIGGAYYTDKTLYAVFSGPRNLRTGSILCSFSIRNIKDVFQGPYLVYDKDTREWTENKETSQPFSCSKKKSVEFARVATLMAKSISQTSPLYYTETNTRLTSVAVKDIVLSGSNFTIVYAGSEAGTIVRVGLERGLTGNIHSSIIRAGGDTKAVITSLTLPRDNSDVIYALTSDWVSRIPTNLESGCHHASTCNECLDLFYPYCSWCYSGGSLRCISKQTDCKATELVKPTDTCLPLPVFGVEPEDAVSRHGSHVTMRCKGRDGEIGVWSRSNGAPISRAATYTEQGYLLLPLVELSDMGCYVCTLNNTSGTVSQQGCLNVTEKPSFVMQPENISAFEEDINIELQCKASGSPQPKILWHKEGSVIPEGSEVTEQGHLRIYRVLPQDEGYYWCSASNSEGVVNSRKGYLKISGGPMEKKDDNKNSVMDGISTGTVVGMVVAGVVIAMICFSVGLIVHKLYRRHKKKRDTDINQTQHIYNGQVHAQNRLWTPVNTLPYQMCRQDSGGWRDSGMYSSCTLTQPPPLPFRPDLLGQLTLQRAGHHHPGDALLEEDEAPPAYDDRNSDSPPLLPPTPVSLQAPMCFSTSCRGGRYTPTHHFNTCPGGGTGVGAAPAYCTPHNLTNSPLVPPTTSHYTPLNNSDYAVISQAPSMLPISDSTNQRALHRQYSRDVDLQAAGHRHFNDAHRPLELPAGFNHDNI